MNREFYCTDDMSPVAVATCSAVEGNRVRIEQGPLKGLEGILIERNADDRCLLQLYDGVILETTLCG